MINFSCRLSHLCVIVQVCERYERVRENPELSSKNWNELRKKIHLGPK